MKLRSPLLPPPIWGIIWISNDTNAIMSKGQRYFTILSFTVVGLWYLPGVGNQGRVLPCSLSVPSSRFGRLTFPGRLPLLPLLLCG